MVEPWPRPCVQTALRSVYTNHLGKDSPIQTSRSVNMRADYFLREIQKYNIS